MPRIRTIKHKFFLDSDLAKLEPLQRLFFIGLWTLADREGRLDDNPAEIGIQLIPYDLGVASADDLLEVLEPRFIVRYEVGGMRYIQIRNFKKHQRPCASEAKSEIPAPKHENMVFSLRTTIKNVGRRLKTSVKERKGRERKGKEREGAEAQAHERKDNDIREDKDKTAAPPSPASPHFPEEDILRVADAYCKLRFPMCVGNRTYLRGDGVFYPAKDLLALNAGNVDRAILCLTHFNEYYTDKDKLEWNWHYVLEDFPKWDEGMRAQEAKEIQNVKPA